MVSRHVGYTRSRAARDNYCRAPFVQSKSQNYTHRMSVNKVKGFRRRYIFAKILISKREQFLQAESLAIRYIYIAPDYGIN